ncbi:hypothetical protein [uncultured Roseibium sp.]|uniref:hypothetical protein n=1 Tax=uncultured Roseibium sp. TaxID=1936171 RepID=UPI002631DDEB|nr:hypothetical protein [uncultured Roseibium sp.]
MNLNEIANTTPEILATTPPTILKDLQDEIAKHEKGLKATKSKLSKALSIRFGKQAEEFRALSGKPNGTVSGVFDGAPVKCERSKKVEWDGEALGEILPHFTQEERDELEIKVEIKIPEKNYDGAPSQIKTALDKARTVTYGDEKLSLK